MRLHLVSIGDENQKIDSLKLRRSIPQLIFNTITITFEKGGYSLEEKISLFLEKTPDEESLLFVDPSFVFKKNCEILFDEIQDLCFDEIFEEKIIFFRNTSSTRKIVKSSLSEGKNLISLFSKRNFSEIVKQTPLGSLMLKDKKYMCVIMNGHLRTFHKLKDKYLNFFEKCSKKYYVHLITIVNGDDEGLKDFNPSVASWKRAKFSNSDEELIITQDHFEKYRDYYSSTSFEEDPLSVFGERGPFLQFFQLRKGLRYMKHFEYHEHVIFDVVVKLRFDINLPDDFVPFEFLSFDFPFNLFPHSKKYLDLFEAKFKKMEEYKRWLESKSIHPKNKSIDREDGFLNFGGSFLYNTLIPDNFLRDNFLWMYNDYIIVGEREEMLKLISFPDFVESGENISSVIEIGKKLKIEKLTAPESQLNCFLIKSGVIPVMYFDDGFVVRG